MWNLTPEYIQQVKEELRGRRAAIQARHADELKSLEQDIEEIEALERMAYAVAVKHLPEAVEPSDQPKASPEVMAELEGLPAEPVAAGPVLAGVPVIVVGVLEAEDAAGLAEELQAVNSTAIQASDAQAATCRGLGAFEVLTMSNPFNAMSHVRRGAWPRGWHRGPFGIKSG